MITRYYQMCRLWSIACDYLKKAQKSLQYVFYFESVMINQDCGQKLRDLIFRKIVYSN